jgi:hypothetical protein
MYITEEECATSAYSECLTLTSHTTKAYNRSLYKKYKNARETGIACSLLRNAALLSNKTLNLSDKTLNLQDKTAVRRGGGYTCQKRRMLWVTYLLKKRNLRAGAEILSPT